jgi:outer membrane lipoprotein-sorting protein
MGVVKALAWLVLLMAALVTAACGNSADGATGPPGAAEILNKPYTANVKDAHFTLVAHVVSGNIAFDATGDGALVVKPQPAMKFTMLSTVGGQPLKFETIIIGGKEYSLSPDNPRWTVTSSASSSNPSSMFKGTSATYVGEETLAQGKAWHVKAKDAQDNPFDAWVRVTDGYPLKYASMTQGWTFTATFDRFNTGQTVSAPPASDIQP